MTTGLLMTNGRLTMILVYDRPCDFPDCCVARPHLIESTAAEPVPGPIACIGTLGELRRGFRRQGMVRAGRHAGNEPPLVETWF